MLNIFHYCADMVGLHILKWKKRVEIIPITLLHTYGQKWSTYLMSFVDEVMKTELSIVPRFEVKKNAVVIRIREV
jgi:hypothetical protein